MIASAIDAKSPYTGAHCQRVPVIFEMLTDAACAATEGPFRDFDLNEEERYELKVAAWLHDCGKVATPEHIIDKASKLQCVRDRIHEIAARIEVVKRDVEISCLQQTLKNPGAASIYWAEMLTLIRRLDDDLRLLERVNAGDEFMTDEMIARVESIAAPALAGSPRSQHARARRDEVENLSIRSGTLNERERQIVNRHVEISIDMLNELPFPPAAAAGSGDRRRAP